MRIHALLSFYDEPVQSLVACLTGLKDAGVDNVIALDGAYALYPEGQAASSADQHAAIVLACSQLGMGCTLSIPREPWAGNEVQKRTALFQLAWSLADDLDWFLVMDADQVITKVPDDFRERLEAAEHDAAETTFLDVVALQVNQPDWPPYFVVRNVFRAQSIRVHVHHFTYIAGDGRVLCGNDSVATYRPIEPSFDLTDLVIEHRPNQRSTARQLAKLAYYGARDDARIERGLCACGKAAVELVPMDWRMTDIGPVASWHEACELHVVRYAKRAAYQLRGMGIDPDSVSPENRNGHAPPKVARIPERTTS